MGVNGHISKLWVEHKTTVPLVIFQSRQENEKIWGWTYISFPQRSFPTRENRTVLTLDLRDIRVSGEWSDSLKQTRREITRDRESQTTGERIRFSVTFQRGETRSGGWLSSLRVLSRHLSDGRESAGNEESHPEEKDPIWGKDWQEIGLRRGRGGKSAPKGPSDWASRC